MADSFEKVVQDLFGAMETISKSVSNSMEFDKTIQAEVIDDTNAAQGSYIVSDGSSKFKAYSENTSYREGDNVYVSIPKGDFNKQKMITGRRMEEEDNFYNYIAALERHIDITSNLIDSAEEQYELVANGNVKQITVWEDANFPNGVGYTKLGLRGEFKTWLSSLKADKGSYGLRVDIIGEETNTTQTKPENKFYTFKLDCSEFYGNAYNFETFYSQETSFDISHIDKIISIRLVFYQEQNFKNNKGELIAANYEDGRELDANIFLCNPYISLGYDFSELEEDEVKLYTLDSKTYTSFMNPDVKLELFKNEIGLTPEQDEALTGWLKRISVIDGYFTEYEQLKIQAKENYDSGLIDQDDYNNRLAEIENMLFEENTKTREQLATEKTEINQRIQDLYNDYDFNNDELLKHYCNKLNLKTIHVRWLHLDEQGNVQCIDNANDMPEGSRIHWYKWNNSTGITDKLAGVFWEEFLPNSKENSFVYINFSPDFDLATEQIKVVIECKSEDYINTAIDDDNEITKLKDQLNDKESDLDEIERGRLENEFNNLVAEYREQINYYNSEILTFFNEDKSSNDVAADLISNLEIVCDEENQKGIYNLYTQNGNIIAQAEATKKRILTATYNTLVTGQDLFDTAEKITWRFPTRNTMIQYPVEGEEYTSYSLRVLATVEDFKAGSYYFLNPEYNQKVKEAGDAYESQLKTLYTVYEQKMKSAADAYTEGLKTATTNAEKENLKKVYDDALKVAEEEYNTGRDNAEAKYQDDVAKIPEYIPVPSDHVFDPQTSYYVKNNYEVIENEAEGYVDIIRYGIVSSRVPGTEEADSTDQYFRIKPQYSQNFTNNTIKCTISKNNKDYIASYDMSFGAVGTNGTDYTFTLSIDNAVPAMTWASEEHKDKRQGITVKPKVFDHEQKEITADVKNYFYTWYSFGDGGIEMIPDGQNCRLNFTETNAFKTKTELKNCKHYILECRAKVNVAFTETKVDANLTSTETTSGSTTEVEDSEPETTAREVELTAYLSVPVRNITDTIWTQFSGTDKICYDVNGTNAIYYQGKQSLSYYDDTQKKTIQDNNVLWEVELGNDTGLYEQDPPDPYREEKVLKYYPRINEEGHVVATSLYIQGNGKQISIIGRKGGNIQWIQPIRIYQDAYSAVGLNSWDGSLTIDEENGKIMSAMIGAGKKDDQNRFEGILMGDVTLAGVNEGDSSAEEGSAEKELSKYYNGTGLYGYNQGVKSFGLNINGKAFFGKPGNGQILMDGNSGTIQSRRYMETKDKIKDESKNVILEQGLEIGTSKRWRVNEFAGMQEGTDASGMIIDLDDGYLKTYGEDNASSVIIDPNASSTDKAFFQVKSKKGTPLLHVGDTSYYLQSDDYVTETNDKGVDENGNEINLGLGSGLKFDLEKGSLNAYNFNLKATNGSGDRYSGSYIQISSDGTTTNPYFRVFYKDSESTSPLMQEGRNIINVTNQYLTLRSQDWDNSTKGTQLMLGASKDGYPTLSSYDFNLSAKTSDGTEVVKISSKSPYFHIKSSTNKDLMEIGDSTLYLQSNNYKEGTFSGTLPCPPEQKGAGMRIDVYKGKIQGYDLDLAAYNASNNKKYVHLNSAAPTNPFKIENITDGKYIRCSWDGKLSCNDIKADGGTIGGWVIANPKLKSSGGTIFLNPNGEKATVLGAERENIVFKAGSQFGVNSSGKLFASGAVIKDSYAYNLYINTGTTDSPKWSEVNTKKIEYVTSISIDTDTTGLINVVGWIGAATSDAAGNGTKFLTGFDYSLKELQFIKKVKLSYSTKTFTTLGTGGTGSGGNSSASGGQVVDSMSREYIRA